MCVFGKGIGSHYSKYINGKIIRTGSLKNNYYKIQNQRNLKSIVFISQFIGTNIKTNNTVISHRQYIEENDKKIIKTLLKFAKQNDKDIYILLRQNKVNYDLYKKEIKFYSSISSELKFYENKNFFSSYGYIDSAGVVVSIDSTLGYESLARGNPSLILSGVRGNNLKLYGLSYGWPGLHEEEGLYWINHLNEKKIFKKLRYLMKIEKKEFKQILKNDNFYLKVMAYNKDNSKIIKLVNKLLKS